MRSCCGVLCCRPKDITEIPSLARNIVCQGIVKVEAVVATDGSVKTVDNGSVKTVDIKGGHPVLAQQWRTRSGGGNGSATH